MDGFCTVCKGHNVSSVVASVSWSFQVYYFMRCVDLFPILCTNVHRSVTVLSVFESLEQFCQFVVVFDIKQFL